MIILSNFLSALGAVVDLFLSLLYWLILIRALISWVNPDPYNVVVQFLYRTTDPILQPIRNILPSVGIDIAPIIVFFGIIFLKSFLVSTLYDLARRLKIN